MVSIAWENLEPIQRAQLLHFYPQLREEYQVRLYESISRRKSSRREEDAISFNNNPTYETKVYQNLYCQ